MTRRQELRLNARLSMLVACAAAVCLVIDVCLIVTGHPTGYRLARDIAFLVLYGCGAYAWIMRYRRLTTQIGILGPGGD